jgi:subtilisin family serine protease
MKSSLSTRILLSAVCASVLSMAGAASAAPTIDKEVQQFLNARGTEQVLPVLLTYKQNAAAIPHRPWHPRFHAEIEKAMIRNTQLQEAAVFKTDLKGSAVPQKTLWIVNGTTTLLRQDQVKSLMTNPSLSSITYARKKVRVINPAKEPNPPPVGTFTYGLEKLMVPELRTKYPTLDGSGIAVGILDTGIDATHPDLAGKVKTFKDFTADKSPTPSDGHGHGTHVAGTIAGGSTSGISIGVAPKVQLVIAKIFDADGSASDEDIMQAMQWIADPDGNPDTNDFPRIVSNSWGSDGPFDDKNPEDEPFCKITKSWVKLGMIPVFAAGNAGPGAATVGTPGGCPAALAVAATDENDRAAYFSSRGPAKWKSGPLAKPDIAAPGVNVTSAKPGGGYQSMSGTSMATPHISGVMAILLQAHPEMTVDASARALMAGAKDLGSKGKDMIFGWGRADIVNSIDLMQQPGH